MRALCALALACIMAVGAAEPAFARGGGSAAGGGGNTLGRSHDGGSHPRSRSRQKSGDGYIVRHCKTAACFKKHPSGEYGFYPGHKKG